MMRPVAVSILILAAPAGCAGMKPQMGFDEVSESVSQRASLRLHWNNGTEADAAAQAAVADLLAHDLTADEAVQIALLNNHDLQATYEELSLAQGDLVQAGLLKNPVFSGEVRFATSGGGTGVVLDVAQDFVSLFSLPLRKGRAQAEFEAAQARVAAEVLDMAFETRTAFFDYQAAEQMRDMRATVLQAASASYALAKRLRQAGNNRDLDVSNERSFYEQSKIDLAKAENDALQLRERMNALMGLWGDQTGWTAGIRLPGLAADVNVEGIETRAIEASLDLAVLRREVEVAARTVGIAKPFGWLTDAETGAAAEREIEGDWSVGPSLTVPIPLFDQGQASVGGARARLRQASERYFARAVEIRSRVRAALADMNSAFDRARYYEAVILPLRQQIVEQTQLQYNAMQASAFQLLQAKRDQIEAGVQYIESLRDYWQARAAFDQIMHGRMTPFESQAGGSHAAFVRSRSEGRQGGHQ